jgi:isocitrate lyase
MEVAYRIKALGIDIDEAQLEFLLETEYNWTQEIYNWSYQRWQREDQLIQKLISIWESWGRRKIKGLLSLRDSMVRDFIYKKCCKNFEIVMSEDIAVIHEELVPFAPDFVYLHCHTKEGDFEEVKTLTRRIRSLFPKCVIIMNCTMEVNYYITYHQIDENPYDYAFSRELPANNLTLLILKETINRHLGEVPVA